MNNAHALNNTHSNTTTNMTGVTGTGNQATSSHATGTGGRHSSGPASKRPKRARGKGEKKEDNECPSRFHCDYCGRDLSSSVRARCAICLDYDSCLDCFSVGAALEPHKADHDYRLIEVVHTPIFQDDWSADEEEKLLEGLETFGIGNWEQVAKLIGTKNPIETEQHYLKIYLQSPYAPLPDPNHLEPALDLTNSDGLQEQDDPKALRVMHKHQQEDAAGWMPKRQDFVYEWDNEAEEIIGDMDITEEDTKSDRERKQKVLEIYCHKLDERERRKEFVHERNLTDVKAQANADKKRSKEEIDLREKLKIFMRLLNLDEIDRFIHGVLDEKNLRSHIEMLKHGRNLGAKTPEECQRIHAKAVKKELRLSNNAASSSATGSASVSASLGGGGNSAHMSSPNPSGTGNAGGMLSNNGSNAGGANSTVSGGGMGNSGTGGEASVVSGVSSQRRGRRSTGGGGGSGEHMSEAQSASANGHSHGHGHYHGGYHGNHDSSKDRRWILSDVDIEAMAGSELLSAKEINLCKSLDLIPQQYLIIKEVMIRENARNGSLRKKDVRAIIKFDMDKVFKIYGYLLGCGWIRNGTSGGGGGSGGPGSSSASIGNGIRSAPSGGGTSGGTGSSGPGQSGGGGGGGGGGSANASTGGSGTVRGSSTIGNKSQSERT